MIRLPSVLPYTHEGILFKLVQEDFILKDKSAKYVTAIGDIPQSTVEILWSDVLKLWNRNSVNKQNVELHETAVSNRKSYPCKARISNFR